MARRKTGRGRGRPRKTHARRRQTTREGRRTGVDPVDPGTAQLRARKRRLTTREDLPLDAGGVLHGRGLLDGQQYSALSQITSLLQRAARAWGQSQASVGGLWLAMLGAGIAGHRPIIPVPEGADAARYRLARICARLDGSRQLVITLAEGRMIPPLVERVIMHQLTARDLADLERLRAGLDAISGYRPSGSAQRTRSWSTIASASRAVPSGAGEKS